MSGWWEHANPGAPMVGPAMVRPLYPPDAVRKGKTASADGDDVAAIKRGIARGGRWPWQAFDDSYSNGFAHGLTGMVAETGLAGFQRQNHIDPTGWMGEHTYNAIRSALVPDGLPHAGEHILDAVAINLLEAHAAAFTEQGTVRELALELARQQIGYVESPPGTNGNMYGAWYGMNYEPWCAIFVSYCFEHVAHGSPTFTGGSTYAYVPFLVADAHANRNGLTVIHDDPIPGDLACYDWSNSDGIYDHIGIFEDGNRDDFDAIEANTSASGDQSNGGQVMRKKRASSDADIVFVRVAEPA